MYVCVRVKTSVLVTHFVGLLMLIIDCLTMSQM